MLRRSPAPLRQGPAACFRLVSKVFLAQQLHTQRWLDTVNSVFPDTKDLHARVVLVLDKNTDHENSTGVASAGKGVVRVAFVPFQVHPSAVNKLVDAVLADPLASDLEWYRALRIRQQGANTLIKYNRTLTKTTIVPPDGNVDSDDARLEFGVPFTVPRASSGQPNGTRISDPREIEIHQLRSPVDHIGRFHRYIYICDDPHIVKTHQLKSNFPHHLFLDVSKAQLKRNSKSGSDVDSENNTSEAIIVSSQAALEANELLRRSPTLNGSYFSDLTLQSHIAAVKDATFGENLDASKQTLVKGITATCREIVVRDERVETIINTKSPEVERTITAWTSKAHYELQTAYADALDNLFQHTLRWWNLYWKVDEVHYFAATALLVHYLPLAQQAHLAIVDDMNAFGTANYFPDLAEVPVQFPAQLTTSRNNLVNTAAVELHNRGQRELLKNFVGIQLPSVFFSLLGAFFFQLPVTACAAAVVTGLFVGAVRLRRGWERSVRRFMGDALEDARMAIRAEQQGLQARWMHMVARQRSIASDRRKILDEASGANNSGTVA